ncbi:MAG: hypothetical protein K0Q49_83 [Haloplasmataceae bacterium]|nr:hypothetical protein [Haloplasmataceae bacterium]
MGKIIKNKHGASLIEIVATVAIVAISLTMIFSVLDFSVRQNGVNQDKSININVANGVLNYIRNTDYDLLNTYLYPEETATYGYVLISDLRCNDIYSYDQNICSITLAPTINNRKYNHDNLKVFLLPFNDFTTLNDLKATPPVEFPQILINHLGSINTESGGSGTRNIIRIVVIVESSINSKHDILLEGVITNDNE